MRSQSQLDLIPVAHLLLPHTNRGTQRKEKGKVRPVCSGPGGSGAELIQGVLTSEEHKVWQQLWGNKEIVYKTYFNLERYFGKHSDF